MRPLSCYREKGGSDPWSFRNASEGAPLSPREAIVLLWSSKKKTVRVVARGRARGDAGPGTQARPGRALDRSAVHQNAPLHRQGEGETYPARQGESATLLWDPARGWGAKIFTFLQAGCRRGTQGAGKKVKENKLFSPLNIHDSSFTKANGKHINPFTTLLNAKGGTDEGHSRLPGTVGGTRVSGPQDAGSRRPAAGVV